MSVTAFVLVVWFGTVNSQTTFSVSDIASAEECKRLGADMATHYRAFTDVKCFPYQKAQ